MDDLWLDVLALVVKILIRMLCRTIGRRAELQQFRERAWDVKRYDRSRPFVFMTQFVIATCNASLSSTQRAGNPAVSVVELKTLYAHTLILAVMLRAGQYIHRSSAAPAADLRRQAWSAPVACQVQRFFFQNHVLLHPPGIKALWIDLLANVEMHPKWSDHDDPCSEIRV